MRVVPALACLAFLVGCGGSADRERAERREPAPRTPPPTVLTASDTDVLTDEPAGAEHALGSESIECEALDRRLRRERQTAPGQFTDGCATVTIPTP